VRRLFFVFEETSFMARNFFSAIFLTFFVFSMLICSACSKEENVSQLEIKRLQAHNEIQNVMGRYAFFHTSGMNFLAAEKLFTTYDDTVIEMMWGRFTGKDAAYRAYTVGHRIYDQPTITALKLTAPELTPDQQILVSSGTVVASVDAQGGTPVLTAPAGVQGAATSGAAVNAGTSAAGAVSDQAGVNADTSQPPAVASITGGASLQIQALTTPVIEVAGDGETARAVWFCPGLEGLTPTWMKFGCDFKQQDGEWKIWHLHVYGIATGLTEKDSYTPITTASKGANKPPTTSWEYSNTAKYIPYEPEPPQPYDTWDYAKIQPKSYGDPN
jgi:hypothetical protein